MSLPSRWNSGADGIVRMREDARVFAVRISAPPFSAGRILFVDKNARVTPGPHAVKSFGRDAFLPVTGTGAGTRAVPVFWEVAL